MDSLEKKWEVYAIKYAERMIEREMKVLFLMIMHMNSTQ